MVGGYEAGFYDSMISMFNQVLKILDTVEDNVKGKYMPRLRLLVEKTKNIGWGYHDYLAEAVAEIES
jgi:hypothetical protein